jgi:tetratricopeptide (TPR) repeat protein
MENNFQEETINPSQTQAEKLRVAKTFYQRACTYLESRDYTNALSNFTKAIRLNSDEALYHGNKALVLFFLKRSEEAFEHCDIALALQPEKIDYYDLKIWGLNIHGRYTEALELLKQAFALKPGFAKLHSHKAYALFYGFNKADDALAGFQKALELDPGCTEAQNHVGNVFLKLKGYAEALACFERSSNLTNFELDCLKQCHIKNPDYLLPIEGKEKALQNLPAVPVIKEESPTSSQKTTEKVNKKVEEVKEPETNQLKAQEADLQAEAAACYEQACRYYECNNYTEALTYFDLAIEMNPGIVRYYEHKAFTLFLLQQYEEALKICNEAIKLQPNNALYNHKGNVLLKLKRYDEASACFQQIELTSRFDIDRLSEYKIKSSFLYLLPFEGKTESRVLIAAATKEKSLAISQKSAVNTDKGEEVKESMGSSQSNAHKDKDKESLQKIRDAEAKNKQGYKQYNFQNYEAALLDFDQAIALNPKEAEYHTRKGYTLFKLKKFDAALVCFNDALALSSSRAKKAKCFSDKGEVFSEKAITLNDPSFFQEALKCYEEGMKLNPRDALIPYNKGEVLFTLGDYKAALICYGKAIEISPGVADYYNKLGRAHAQLKEYEEAVIAFQQAVELQPNDATFNVNLGVMYYNRDSYSEAFKKAMLVIICGKRVRLLISHAIKKLWKVLKSV